MKKSRIDKSFTKNKILRSKTFWVAVGMFLFYLLTLPQVVSQLVPCLKLIPGASYTWEECHMTLALDWYIGLALIGLAVTTLGVFIASDRPKFTPTLTIALVLSVSTILAYYLYISHAEAQVTRAPMIIEPAGVSR